MKQGKSKTSSVKNETTSPVAHTQGTQIMMTDGQFKNVEDVMPEDVLTTNRLHQIVVIGDHNCTANHRILKHDAVTGHSKWTEGKDI